MSTKKLPMALPSLFALAAEYQEAAQKLAEMDLDEQAVLDTLEGLQGTLEVKARNVAIVHKNMDALAEAMKNASKELAARAKAVEARADRLADYLKAGMEAAKLTVIDRTTDQPYFKLSIRNNPPALDIFDEKAVPEEYLLPQAPPPPRELDRARIKETIIAAMEAAEAAKTEFVPPIPGARVTRGTRLEIK